ncbi:MAG: TldD/PmbA family protein [Thermoplasmatota archaeon]
MPDKYEELVKKLLEKVKVDQAEIRLLKKDTSLTRYANSRIHQNITQEDTTISIRAVDGKKVGSSSTNSIDEKSLMDCLRRAENIAKHQKEDPQFKGLPEPKEGRNGKAPYDKETAVYSPKERADIVKQIIDHGSSKNVDRMYGAFKTEELNLMIANSEGIHRSSTMTNANLTSTAIADWDNDQGFGWSEESSYNVNDINYMNVARTAVEKGLNNMNTESIELGEYTVVLEPLAVQLMLMYFGFMGFSSRSVQEQRSFMNGKFGEQIVDERVNIYDDALDNDMVGFPFDYEGLPKQRVDIIKDGIANEVVYDSYTAGRDEEDKESTGHALPMPSSQSPLPLNILMGGGDSSVEEMIEETDKGILVTRFNYCRPVHPVKSILTGLTRDGTWLIKDGEVTKPVKNLRFTQNLLEAFDSVELIGEDREMYSLGYFPGYITAPAMKIPNFNFTGTTEF